MHRVEVRPVAGQPDPSASNALLHAKRRGLAPVAVRSAKVYLIEGSLDHAAVAGIASELLVDPVTERAIAGAGEPTVRAGATIEVHALPGVMDPAAQSVREAIYELTGERVEVSTGLRYDIEGVDGPAAVELARSAFANPAVHQIREGVWRPERLPKGDEYKLHIRRVTLRGLDDASLAKLSRDAHLFLNVAEMRAVQAEFDRLGRDPTDIELETIAQTWSEHCVHKTLKATIRYTSGVPAGSDVIAWATLPGHTVNQDGSVTITNLLKSTIAAATHELIADGVDWALSVFKDNSGVVALDDTWGVNIKVETHNRPSAIEPYGGAATGIGGCIRDVIGTGLGAKPIASTDVFCVADPARWHEPGKLAAAEHRSNEEDSRGSLALPPGVLHPRRILADVVAGVRDYGNRMGIPTVSGGVFFDDRYVGNPLVFCGCIGLIPRSLIKGAAKPGDRIIAMGGRTGRDGIHGATFSSAELASTSASEFAHAVQIGNAIEEKRLLDAVLRARDAEGGPLYHGITDCGAGGFSSAVGEMGGELGARVTLENAPTKYAGLSYTEVWISEAQERMVLAVPPENIGALQRICDEEHVEIADLGEFGTPGAELILTWRGAEVGRMPMAFLHEGIPNPTREAVWKGSGRADERTSGRGASRTGAGSRITDPASAPSVQDALLKLLAHPTIASKHWIVRQYDHEVQGNTVVKPLVGPAMRGPGDAAVVEPVAGSGRGIALSQGLQPPVGDAELGGDPYWMALASIDECVRNLVCVGADPARAAILDNFCWASCDKPENLGALVRAAEGCYAGAKAYRAPFVSGKDSLSNQIRYTDPATGEQRLIEIPPTLLITGIGIVQDVSRCVTMDAKKPGRAIVIVSGADLKTSHGLAASMYANLFGVPDDADAIGNSIDLIPRVSLAGGPAAAKAVHELIRRGVVFSAHDCSEGGVAVALAEMLIAGSTKERPIGADVSLHGDVPDAVDLFGEAPSRYLLEIDERSFKTVRSVAKAHGVSCWSPGVLTDDGRLTITAESDTTTVWPVEDLARAWLGTLDW